MVNERLVGNSSTVFKTLGLIIAGYTTPWLIKLALLYLGVDLSGQETEIMQFLGVIIGIILSYIDAKFSNTFFSKETGMTLEDYVQYGIDNFNLKPVKDDANKVDRVIIEDIDTAIEYDKL